MGQSHSQSDDGTREVPIEQLSHELALRFASRCYSPLEITHFKDNFKTLADHQEDVEYWKEDTLCRFLCLPDAIRAGPVLYQMATYLGAFPFPSLAPCIVTREALLKVITIMTGRYKKVLKRGDHDKNKLLFRSLAVFDRRASSALSPTTEKRMFFPEQRNTESTMKGSDQGLPSHTTAFAVDEPMNDEEDEDDDDLALEALDALDAIEVFKQDQRMERKIHMAHIPQDNFRRLLALILLLGPLTPQDNIALLCESVSDNQKDSLLDAADALVAAFDPNSETDSITYSNFVKSMTMVTPQLFRPLNPLFEHFLFSKHLDLNKHRDTTERQPGLSPTEVKRSPIFRAPGDEGRFSILNDVLLAQLSCSIEIAATSSPASSSFFHCGVRLNQLYSTETDGTSLSSFSRQIVSWRAATLLILSGTDTDSGQTHILGAYLPDHWKEAGAREPEQEPSKAMMFQLKPRHAIFRANPTNRSTPVSYFSSRDGIALGCIIPSQSRVLDQPPVLGPVSLMIDQDLSSATFQHDGSAGIGAFLTDPRMEEAQQGDVSQPKKIELEVDAMEVWGISSSDRGGEDEITKQQSRLAWEEAEAARRRGVNFGGDKNGARALLEMAGLVGDEAGHRSGGSV